MSGNRNTYVPTRRPGKYICVPGARNDCSDSDEDHTPCQIVYQPSPQPRPPIAPLPPRSNIIVFPPVNTYIFSSNQGGSNTATGATGATGATQTGNGSGLSGTGATGATGASGITGYTGLDGIATNTGATGATGRTGSTGSSGTRILAGSGDPNFNSFSTIGYIGDFYIDLTSGILYGPRN
jgi:hypothetical protein